MIDKRWIVYDLKGSDGYFLGVTEENHLKLQSGQTKHHHHNPPSEHKPKSLVNSPCLFRIQQLNDSLTLKY
jgi:hypothetical protein